MTSKRVVLFEVMALVGLFLIVMPFVLGTKQFALVPTGPNLLVNPGFENALTGWSVWIPSTATASFTTPTSSVFNGTASLLINVTRFGGDTTTLFQARADLTVGATYLFQCEYKAAQLYFGAWYYNSSNSVISGVDVRLANSSSVWSQSPAITVGPVPVGTTRVDISLETRSVTFSYVDDVSLYLASLPTPGNLYTSAYYDNATVAASFTIQGVSGTYHTDGTAVSLNPGTYTVTCTYQGATLDQQATITSQQNTYLNFYFASPPPVGTGYLYVSAYYNNLPVSAPFTIQGVSGTYHTDGTGVLLTPGTYSVTCSYQGQTLVKPAVITSGQNTQMTFTFNPSPPPAGSGYLLVSSYYNNLPVAATFTVQGAGSYPVNGTAISLAPGTYVVSCTYAGTTLSQQATITNGATASLAFNFNSTPPPTYDIYQILQIIGAVFMVVGVPGALYYRKAE